MFGVITAVVEGQELRPSSDFGFLPCSWLAVLSSCGNWRPANTQIHSTSVGMCGGACGPSTGAVLWATLHCENPPHVVRATICWVHRWNQWSCSRRRFSRGARLSARYYRLWGLLSGRRHLTRPLTLCFGHEIVAVAIATSIPEVGTLRSDDIKVVPWDPVTAGASSTRQRADRFLNCIKKKANYKFLFAGFSSQSNIM